MHNKYQYIDYDYTFILKLNRNRNIDIYVSSNFEKLNVGLFLDRGSICIYRRPKYGLHR
jgi:hypothetical protein